MLKQNRKKHLISHARNKKPMKKDQPKTVKSNTKNETQRDEENNKITKWPKVIKKIINSRKTNINCCPLVRT